MIEKNFRLLSLLLLVLMLCVSSGCSGGSSGTGNSLAAGAGVNATTHNATITSPIAVDSMNVMCGILGKSTVSGTRASILVNKDIAQQFVTIENSQGPVLAVMVRANSTDDIQISARTTAEALVLIHPFLIRLSPDSVIPVVRTSTAIATLASAIDAGIRSNPNFIMSQDAAFLVPYTAAVKAVIDSLVANEAASGVVAKELAAARAAIKRVTPPNCSLATKSGIEISQVRKTEQPLSGFDLTITNSLPRYCMAFLDATGAKGIETRPVGPALLSTNVPNPALPPQVNMVWDPGQYPHAELRIYGPSLNVAGHAAAMAVDGDFQARIFKPTLAMLTYEFIVPWVQSLAGVNMASAVSFVDTLSAKAMADPDFVRSFNGCIANGDYISMVGYLQYFISHLSDSDLMLLTKSAFPASFSVDSTVEVFRQREKVFGSPLFLGSSAITSLPAVRSLYSTNPVESWTLTNDPSSLSLSVESIKSLTVDLHAGGNDFFMYEWFFGTDPRTMPADVIEIKNGAVGAVAVTTSQESHTFPKEGIYLITVIGTDIDGARIGRAVNVQVRSIDHISVTCDVASVGTGGKARFVAKAYDAANQEIPSVPTDYLWAISNGTGSLDINGYFTAGSNTGNITVTATYKYAGTFPRGTGSVAIFGSAIFVSTNAYGNGTSEDALSVTIGTLGKIIDRPATSPEAVITANSGDILNVTLIYNGLLFTEADYGAQQPLELLRFYTPDQHVAGGVPFARFSEKVTAGINTYTYSIMVP